MVKNIDQEKKSFIPILFEEPKTPTNTLIDKFGRHATNLRISVTDRCNLRCSYCMPEKNVKFTSNENLLSFEEITRIVKITHQFGVNQVRITGGEPLVRKELPKLIYMIKQAVPSIQLNMTTNGILLKKFLPELIEAGLERVNISLDTLDSKKYEVISLRDQFHKAMEGIEAAMASSLKVKINAVALKNFNEEEIIDFIEFAIKHKTTIRFIEWMPFTGNDWLAPEFISARELQIKIKNSGYSLIPLDLENSSQTSRDYKINNSKGHIGFIASVSESFCSECNRIRLTADGKLRPCLHSSIETDLKIPMRSGATNEDLIAIIRDIYFQKPKEHPNFLSSKYNSPKTDREMNRIGG
jgi:cyclic pyranopterin phosphate synthase